MPCVLIRDIIFLPGFVLNLVCLRLKFKPFNRGHSEGFKGLNKQTKLSKDPGKNIMPRIITQLTSYKAVA